MAASNNASVESSLAFLQAHLALAGLLDAYEKKHKLPNEKQITVHLKMLRKHRCGAAAFLIQHGRYEAENAECIVAQLCAAWERCAAMPWGYQDLADTLRTVQQLARLFITSFKLYEEGLKTPASPSQPVDENKSPANEDTDEGSPSVSGESERSTIYWVGERTYRVGQSEPIHVSDSHDCILRAFLKHPVLDKPDLVRYSGLDRESILTTLTRLCEGYEGAFKSSIIRPGRRGLGYRANVVEARPTEDEQHAT